MKRCTHCGAEKPLSEFRQYYNGKGSHYRYCKTCESIEMRRKYIVGLGGAATPQQQEDLRKILRLYDLRRSRGLCTFVDKQVAISSIIEDELNNELNNE
jgi:hypothetical protein